jgi:hypothetical protein
MDGLIDSVGQEDLLRVEIEMMRNDRLHWLSLRIPRQLVSVERSKLLQYSR